MHVLVTGSDGYIGSVLVPYLHDRNCQVTGLDTGFYRAGQLFENRKDRPYTITRDIRDVREADLRGFDAVVHLAELSNDPLAEHDPETTYEINHHGTANLASAAKAAGVRRFVYASSCSIYGAGGGEVKTEASKPNPQTAYADCKILCEQALAKLTSENFITTALRSATAFGASPRMRFDLVLNNLAGFAWTTKKIVMTSDGTPWRPLVHILDISQAVELTLRADAANVRGEIFNVGDDAQNYRVREIAEIVASVFPDCETTFGAASSDNRSYRVSFEKIKRHLPEFQCRFSAERGARQLLSMFQSIKMSNDDFNAPPFTRLKQLALLLQTNQIDAKFFWRDLSLDRVGEDATQRPDMKLGLRLQPCP